MSKPDCFAAGEALAMWLLTNPTAAEEFRAVVEQAKLHLNEEHIADYRRILSPVFSSTDLNSNDFANVFHVAWLLIGRALTSLMNANPHRDWGDPPANGSLHFEEDRSQSKLFFYHTVPNATGYYAVSTADMTMPDSGV